MGIRPRQLDPGIDHRHRGHGDRLRRRALGVNEIWQKVKAYWLRHGQKTAATVLGALAAVDLTPYADSFEELLGGKHWHAGLRLIGAAAIFWRATQATQGS